MSHYQADNCSGYELQSPQHVAIKSSARIHRTNGREFACGFFCALVSLTGLETDRSHEVRIIKVTCLTGPSRTEFRLFWTITGLF
jgi:hypothetical protein